MKNIDWLNNFAESFAKTTRMQKKASKLAEKNENIIVDPEDVAQDATVGCVVDYNNKKYKVADLDYSDENGPGVVLSEIHDEELEKTSDVDEDIKNLANEVEEEKEEEEVVEELTEEIAEETVEEPETTEPTEEPVTEPEKVPTNPMDMAMGNYPNKMEKGQEYARVNPGSVFDNGAAEAEVNKFVAEEQETRSNIDADNTVDRTTPAGRYSKLQRLEKENSELQLVASFNNRILRRIISYVK